MASSWSWERDRPWIVLIAATFVLVLLINPMGYVGGGWDDWQYLNAARCWAENGPCLPRTHWEGRWPVFAPIGGIFSLLGESRAALGIWPLAASLAALAMLVLAGNRLAGRPVGWLAGLLFLVTPAFSLQILSPSVEALELALILAGVLAITSWVLSRSALTAFWAGLAFGFAFQVRETALIAIALAGIYGLFQRPRLADAAAALAGFAAPLAAELAIYWAATGDPLFRRQLSLAHTQIPSSELLAPVDPDVSPLFNPQYIANWKHEPGFHVHWLVDGLLNLFLNVKAGLTLALTGILLLFAHLKVAPPRHSLALKLYGLALLHASVLIYALAIDPKARMMFIPLAAASLAMSVLVIELWRGRQQLLPAVAIAVHALASLALLFVHQRTDIVEGPAARWLAQYPGQIEIDPNTRRHLALVRGASDLPGLESDRPYLLYNNVSRCGKWLRRSGLGEGALEVVAEQPISRASLYSTEWGGALCLMRYRRPLTADEVRSAIRRSRVDGRYIMGNRTYLDDRHGR